MKAGLLGFIGCWVWEENKKILIFSLRDWKYGVFVIKGGGRFVRVEVGWRGGRRGVD